MRARLVVDRTGNILTGDDTGQLWQLQDDVHELTSGNGRTRRCSALSVSRLRVGREEAGCRLGAMGLPARASAARSPRRSPSWVTWMMLSGFVALLTSCHTLRDMGGVTAPTDLPRLAADLEPLKDWFAQADGKPRALALLSPT